MLANDGELCVYCGCCVSCCTCDDSAVGEYITVDPDEGVSDTIGDFNYSLDVRMSYLDLSGRENLTSVNISNSSLLGLDLSDCPELQEEECFIHSNGVTLPYIDQDFLLTDLDPNLEDECVLNLEGAIYNPETGYYHVTGDSITYEYNVKNGNVPNLLVTIRWNKIKMPSIETDVNDNAKDALASNVVVYTRDLDIVVENASSDVYVFDMKGRNVAVMASSSPQTIVSVPSAGVYEVVAGNFRKKVICK